MKKRILLLILLVVRCYGAQKTEVDNIGNPILPHDLRNIIFDVIDLHEDEEDLFDKYRKSIDESIELITSSNMTTQETKDIENKMYDLLIYWMINAINKPNKSMFIPNRLFTSLLNAFDENSDNNPLSKIVTSYHDLEIVFKLMLIDNLDVENIKNIIIDTYYNDSLQTDKLIFKCLEKYNFNHQFFDEMLEAIKCLRSLKDEKIIVSVLLKHDPS